MRIVIFFNLVLLCTTCTSHFPNEKDHFKVIVSDTALYHQKFNELNISQQNSQILNLADITRGVDSFELRVWTSAMWVPKQLTIVRYSLNKWIIFEYAYYPNELAVDSALIFNKDVPKNIDNLISYLTSDEILNQPPQGAIPNFIDNVADGQTCFLEIATNKFYKALSYHCPEHFTDFYNKRFMSFIDTINKYVYVYNPMCLSKN